MSERARFLYILEYFQLNLYLRHSIFGFLLFFEIRKFQNKCQKSLIFIFAFNALWVPFIPFRRHTHTPHSVCYLNTNKFARSHYDFTIPFILTTNWTLRFCTCQLQMRMSQYDKCILATGSLKISLCFLFLILIQLKNGLARWCHQQISPFSWLRAIYKHNISEEHKWTGDQKHKKNGDTAGCNVIVQ